MDDDEDDDVEDDEKGYKNDDDEEEEEQEDAEVAAAATKAALPVAEDRRRQERRMAVSQPGVGHQRVPGSRSAARFARNLRYLASSTGTAGAPLAEGGWSPVLATEDAISVPIPGADPTGTASADAGNAAAGDAVLPN